MVSIEFGSYFYSHGIHDEYFYAWIKGPHKVTFGRAVWNRGDDVGYLIKYLILHNFKIGMPKFRRDYVNLSNEDGRMLRDYIKELEEFIIT